MNKRIIYDKLRNLCFGRHCLDCPIQSINPNHRCGCGFGYNLDSSPVPVSEAMGYYSILYGDIESLREIIETRKGKTSINGSENN